MDILAIKVAGAIVLVACASGCGAFLLRRLRRKGMQITTAQNAIALDAVARGIGQHAAEFDGLFEGLYQSAQIQKTFSTDAYTEWCSRVALLDDTLFQNAFHSVFSKDDIQNEALCREKYRVLLRCIEKAGIIRDRSLGLCCVADETMRRSYIEAGGKKPQIGMEYTVIKAAWLRGETVIEYGMVMPGAVNL